MAERRPGRPARQPLLICGTRSFALEVADMVSDLEEFELVGFVENLEPERCRSTLAGLPVIWVDELAGLAATHRAVCALVTTLRRRYTAQVEALGLRPATIVHPTAHVSATSDLGEGAIVGVGAIVGAHSRIGRHTILNRGVLVGHHTVVGDHTSLLPGANVAGNCTIGNGCFVGMGALVLDNRAVGSDAVVAAGAVVTKDVPEAAEVRGVPARVVVGAAGPR